MSDLRVQTVVEQCLEKSEFRGEYLVGVECKIRRSVLEVWRFESSDVTLLQIAGLDQIV